MNKKATLLIKNLEAIYTMEKNHQQDLVYQKGYIAIHHDTILKIGTDDYQSLLDKDTRVLDARGHFAIPAFVEVMGNEVAPSSYGYELSLYHLAMEYFSHGVLTIGMKHCKKEYLEVDFVPNIVKAPKDTLLADCIIKGSVKRVQKQFYLSTKANTTILYDPLLLARLLYAQKKIDPMDMLRAMTCNPAKQLGLTNIGYLKKGMQADILICKGEQIQSLFCEFSSHSIDQIIKRGIRIYPFVIRS